MRTTTTSAPTAAQTSILTWQHGAFRIASELEEIKGEVKCMNAMLAQLGEENCGLNADSLYAVLIYFHSVADRLKETEDDAYELSSMLSKAAAD